MSRFLLAHPTFTAILICFLWGNAFVAIRYCVELVTPLELVLVRFIPALLVILAMAWRNWTLWGPPLRAHWRPLTLYGVLFIWGYHLMLNIGETIILPGLAALIVACSPVFVFLIALALGRDHATARKVGGLSLAVLGLVLSVAFSGQAIGLGREGMPTRTYYLGIAATMSAPLCWAIYTLGIKQLAKTADAFVLTGWVMALGTLPGLLFVDGPFLGRMATATPMFWLAVAYLSLIAAVWAVLWWSKLLETADPTTLSAFIYLVPVFSTLCSAWYYGERLTPIAIVGAMLTLGGLWILNRPTAPPQPPLLSSQTHSGEGEPEGTIG